MTDGTLAHPNPAPAGSAPGRNWARMREQVRDIIRAEVGRLNPTEDARRPLELIVESSVRYAAAEGGTRITVVDPRGQPRTLEKDGKVVEFGIRDLLEELRHTHPALFRSPEDTAPPPGAAPVGPVAASALPEAPERAAPPPEQHQRDWLSVGSGKDGADAAAADNPTLFRLRRGRVRLHGWSRTPIRSRRNPPPVEKEVELPYVPERSAFSVDRVRDAFGGVSPGSGMGRKGLAVAAVALVALLGAGAFAFLGQSRTVPPASADAPAATGTVQSAQATQPAPETHADAPATTSSANTRTLRGVPEVIDTATLSLEGEVVRLFGVEWAPGGGKPDDLARYLQGRETVCEPLGSNDVYRCQVGGQDLSRVVLFNGGGKPTAEATPELKAAADKARESRLGVWNQ